MLFDGLDEVANREVRARLARSLIDLTRYFPGNRVIIGSRPAGVSESEGTLHSLFQRCQIQRFTPEEVRRFFRFWYALDHSLSSDQQQKAADALMARVQAIPATLQLASTPLLSTILVLIWRNTGDLPERRVKLYEYCCRALIEYWEASHDIAYQGVLADKDWEDHLRLLTPLAYSIHSQEQRTSATREELLPLLAQALQTAGYASEPAAASREAKHFLDALGLRSGLLQYMGDDRYGFPHLTFQEYLAARHIAVQPEYIDLVMAHLHEAWWQQVDLLTIALLGSSPTEAEKASSLILTILHIYPPPTWILRPSRHRWLRLIGPGRYLPWVQLERRIAWTQGREFELAAKGYMEYTLNGTGAKIGTVLSAQAVSLVRHLLSDQDHREELLDVTCQLSQYQGGEAAAKALLMALYDRDVDVRRQVAAGLRKLGVDNEAVVKALLVALRNANKWVRMQAAAGLGDLGVSNKVVVKTLLAALHDRDGYVRWQTAKSLGQLGVSKEEAAKALLVTLHDRDLDVRRQAAESLGQLGVDNEAVVEALLVALHGVAHVQAAESLGQLGVSKEVMVRDLLTALHGASEFGRRYAAESLGELGVGNEETAKALLVVALHDRDGYVRREAAKSLGELGVGNEEVVKALLVALHDRDEFMRRQVAESLVKLEVDKEIVAEALLIALHDANLSVRAQAAESLGELGVDNEAVVKALLAALHDRDGYDGYVREQAAKSLGQLGAGKEAVVKALLATLHDRDRRVRVQAANSLGKLGVGKEEAVKAMLAVLHDANRSGRVQAAESLGQLGVSNEEVVKALLVVLHDKENKVHMQATKSLVKLGVGNEVIAKALLAVLHDRDGYVRRQAATTLGELGVGNEEVVKALLVALHDRDEFMRRQVAESLGRLELKDTIQLRRVLVALNRLLYDWDDDTRQTALASIRQLLDGRPIPGYRWEPLRKR